jgi:hypothetical protein
MEGPTHPQVNSTVIGRIDITADHYITVIRSESAFSGVIKISRVFLVPSIIVLDHIFSMQGIPIAPFGVFIQGG